MLSSRSSASPAGMNKYGTAPAAERTLNGIRFDSKAEMKRYIELRMLERSGAIEALEMQTEFVLIEGFVHQVHGRLRPVRYRADFRYREVSTGRVIVEDVKGVRTDVYKIKKTLLLWRYPDIDFREVQVRA
jgi:hypothetical protein